MRSPRNPVRFSKCIRRVRRDPCKCCSRRGCKWWTAWDSNPRPPRCERGALPAELAAPRRDAARECYSGAAQPGIVLGRSKSPQTWCDRGAPGSGALGVWVSREDQTRAGLRHAAAHHGQWPALAGSGFTSVSAITRIGVLTGGGDAPGLNAVIRAVVKSACNHGCECLGLEDSFDGLIHPDRVRVLAPRDVTGILRHGGTILGTSSRGDPFANGRPGGRDERLLGPLRRAIP